MRRGRKEFDALSNKGRELEEEGKDLKRLSQEKDGRSIMYLLKACSLCIPNFGQGKKSINLSRKLISNRAALTQKRKNSRFLPKFPTVKKRENSKSSMFLATKRRSCRFQDRKYGKRKTHSSIEFPLPIFVGVFPENFLAHARFLPQKQL